MCLNPVVGAAEWTDMTAANADQWYGVEWDTAVSSSVCTKIGKTELHTQLPIQGAIKSAAVRDDQSIAFYLHPTDATKKEDGTAADLTGASGQIMAIMPEHYRKFETDGTKRRVKISTLALPGFTKVTKKAVGRYLGNVDGGNKLCSVNDIMPTTNKTRAQFRAYAAARASGWSQIFYSSYLDLFYLYLIEYADFNSQTTLGAGATNANSTDWQNYNAYAPVVKNGVGNSLGNRSGSVAFTVTDWYKGTTTSAATNKCIQTGRFASWSASYIGMTIKNTVTNATAVITAKDSNDQISIDADIFTTSGQGFVIIGSTLVSQCAVYRGIEQFFGLIYSLMDGINVNFVDDNNRLAYICSNPANFADNTATNYTLVGNISATSGYIKSLIPGHVLPETVGGSSSTYMCDYCYIPATNSGWRVVLWFAGLHDGADSGLCCANFVYASGHCSLGVGSRLNLVFS